MSTFELSFLSSELSPCSLKFFMHPDLDDFRKHELETRFAKVVVEKPKESRNGERIRLKSGGISGAKKKSESSEAYWVCLGFKR